MTRSQSHKTDLVRQSVFSSLTMVSVVLSPLIWSLSAEGSTGPADLVIPPRFPALSLPERGFRGYPVLQVTRRSLAVEPGAGTANWRPFLLSCNFFHLSFAPQLLPGLHLLSNISSTHYLCPPRSRNKLSPQGDWVLGPFPTRLLEVFAGACPIGWLFRSHDGTMGLRLLAPPPPENSFLSYKWCAGMLCLFPSARFYFF